MRFPGGYSPLVALFLLILSLLTLAHGQSQPTGMPERKSPFRTAEWHSPPAVVPGPVDAGVGSPCPNDPPTPIVTLRVRVPATAAAGQRLEYRFCVENLSRAPAHHVTVRNPIPANARVLDSNPQAETEAGELVWRFRTLDACACREIVLGVEPSGQGDVRSCARVQFEHGQCVTTRVGTGSVGGSGSAGVGGGARIKLQKTGPTQATLDQTITFQLVISNTGTTEARDIRIVDTLDPGLQYSERPPTNPAEKQLLRWPSEGGFTLTPGESRTIEYRAVVKKEGKLCNVAEVSGPGGVLDRATHCLMVGKASLLLDMSGPDDALVKRPTAYTLSVSNSGSLPLSNVVVLLPLPAGITLVEAGSQGEYRDGQVRWLLETLPPGTKPVNLRVRLSASAPGEVAFRATATASGLKHSAQMSTLFRGASGLTFVTEPEENPIYLGSETSLTVSAVNQGNDSARGVQMTLLVPPQLQIVETSGPDGLTAKRDGGKVIFDKLPELRPQTEAKYRVVLMPKQIGDVRFEAQMTADQPAMPIPVRKQTPLTIADPGK